MLDAGTSPIASKQLIHFRKSTKSWQGPRRAQTTPSWMHSEQHVQDEDSDSLLSLSPLSLSGFPGLYCRCVAAPEFQETRHELRKG